MPRVDKQLLCRVASLFGVFPQILHLVLPFSVILVWWWFFLSFFFFCFWFFCFSSYSYFLCNKRRMHFSALRFFYPVVRAAHTHLNENPHTRSGNYGTRCEVLLPLFTAAPLLLLLFCVVLYCQKCYCVLEFAFFSSHVTAFSFGKKLWNFLLQVFL